MTKSPPSGNSGDLSLYFFGYRSDQSLRRHGVFLVSLICTGRGCTLGLLLMRYNQRSHTLQRILSSGSDQFRYVQRRQKWRFIEQDLSLTNRESSGSTVDHVPTERKAARVIVDPPLQQLHGANRQCGLHVTDSRVTVIQQCPHLLIDWQRRHCHGCHRRHRSKTGPDGDAGHQTSSVS